PLSFAQQRLWFIHQLVPDTPAYNIPIIIRLQGRVNVAVLEQSLNEIIKRHEILRTNFIVIDGQPVQVIQPDLNINLLVEDLQQLPQSDRTTETQHLIKKFAQQTFDLSSQPLLRAQLLRLGEAEYQLVLILNHIIVDGWSIGILIRELSAIYDAFVNGKPSPLPELPIQYLDFTYWQRQWLQGDRLQTLITYWKQQLGGNLPVLDLPTDAPRGSFPTFNGAQAKLVLSPSLSAELKNLCQQEGATLFMVLLAAFKTLLYRYTGQTDILVGSPIASRNRAEIESLIGFFVNVLVLRTSLDGVPSFRELLERVKVTALGAYTHQDLPFEKLVEELQPERHLSHNPLFQVMFVLQNVPLPTPKLSDIDITFEEGFNGTAKFDLTLFIEDREQGLVATLEYNTDLFNTDTMYRMLGHLQTLLEGIVANPDESIAELPLLTGFERKQILVDWNQTQTDYPQHLCIHQLFEAQVEKTPDTIAVVFQHEQLTYQQLNQRANQLAHYLQKLGVQPEVPVCLCVDRSIEMVIGLLGILKAGGAYVPLDPAYPQERLEYIKQDVRSPLLLTQHKLKIQLFDEATQVICLDTDWEEIQQQSQENPVTTAKTNNLAYVIYTSGSTGKPKGTMIVHSGIVNYLSWCTKAYNVSDGEGATVNSSIGFDATITSLFSPLIVGRKVVLLPGNEEIEALKKALCFGTKFSLVKITPAHLEILSHLLDKEPENIQTQALIIGGEALSEKVTAFWQKYAPNTRLINEYGPTETVVGCCIYEVEKQKYPGGNIPIGRPIANTELYILDKYLQTVPIGVVGELYIGGAGVARGYLNRPELTAEKFIPNPFSDQPGTRLYKTGDLARYQPDGNIVYLGRIDNQVKLRGFRIELGEIEAALSEMPVVREAEVILRQDNPGEKRIVAYVVAERQEAIAISDLRRYLSKKLPEYMVPSAFVQLAAMPLTPNGKLDRRALPAPDTSRLNQNNSLIAPQNPTEELLVSIWAEVLNLKQVSIHDNFFELGGHSLLATQLISRIRDTFQIEISLFSLFESPTIASFSDRLQVIRQTQFGLSPQPLAVASRPAELPLSFAQARLWFLDRLEPGNYAYNIPAAVQLSGHLNISALENSFNEIVRRHEALRTTFVMGSNQPIQVITPQQTITISLVDLRDLGVTEQQAQVQHLALEEAKRPFNLATGPLLRVTLLQLGNIENVLLLTMHHIIADGWSIGVLVKELATFYEGFVNGKQPQLPELPIQYADFAIWQRQWLQKEGLESQLTYWKQQLNGAPASLNLPTDRPKPSIQTFRGASTSFTLSFELSEALKTLSRQEGVTLFMTLMATLQTLLHKYTNQEDIVVGTDVANRHRSELEPLIGFFINLLVLRTNFSGNPTFRELLQQVRQVALGAYAHQDLPFAKLVEALRSERNLSHTPLFQVLFVLQNAPMPALEFSGLKLTPLKFETGTTKFDLCLFIEETEQGLLGNWQYSTDLFDFSTITRISGHFETLLNKIVNQPDTRINSLEMLTESEKQNLNAAQKQRQETKFKKLKNIKPKAVRVSPAELVKTSLLSQEETLPLVIEPASEDVELTTWANHREFIESKLLQHGGILFRNFKVNSATEFEKFAQSIEPELFGEYGDLPGAGVEGKVYSSTPYPADKAILFHNESSHLQTWPLKIWFFCVQPAQQGGETPIVDCRKIYQLLNPQLRERFVQKQLMYVRNFIEGLDVNWQQFFRTTDKAVVENYCRQNSIDFEWLPDNNLRTRSYRQAIAKHPRTGEMVFFNQIQLHHVSFLEPSVQKSLLSLFSEDKLPRNVYYGDGSPIEQSVIEEITELYQQLQISFSWQQGDILMLDNMLTAHSRNPYVGARKILVAMGEMNVTSRSK
ncbi:MAG TPA: non-ribosomal peptide synthetase, partial [Cyanobacteria bacterium UBA11049]|nr:non-ribosomal peptide synthetase [Cyanobacteria bacterium UBA11049]